MGTKGEDITEYVFTRPNGQKLHRSSTEKKFWFTGKGAEGLSLFGSDKFPLGGRSITITEGYFDTLAHYEMMGNYPVVGVQSSASAKSECAEAWEYLNSFERIYLAFDSDIPGKKAAEEVSSLFDFNKVYLVKLRPDIKDSNAYLEKGLAKEYTKTWWNSQRYLPEGILSSFAAFDDVFDKDIAKESIPYPWDSLNNMTYGIRTGEVVLITAQEGLGKTEIVRAIEYQILKHTETNVGIIHLEENKARTLKGIVGYELKQPVHLPDRSVSKEEMKETLRKVLGRDDRVHLYSHFGSEDPEVLLNTVRFMAGACQCKYIFLDHITLAVTGLQGEDERKALDFLSTKLAMMTEELDFTLFLVSHVNDNGQTRGSRNIGKIANMRIDLHRDLTAEDPLERNTTKLIVSKNRFSGTTGPSTDLVFDTQTYILNEKQEEEGELPF